MIQKLTDTYTYERQLGGIVLADVKTGEDVFFQPGDDAYQFNHILETVDNAYKAGRITAEQYEATIDILCGAYF